MIRYVQVAVTVATREKFMQESAVFAAIRDNYPKYITTLDDIFVSERNGIQIVEVADGKPDSPWCRFQVPLEICTACDN